MIQTFKMLLGFFVPGGLVFFAALLVLTKGYLTPWLPQIVPPLPYIILGTGLLLGLRFHHSRLAFAVLILFLTEKSLLYLGPGGILHFNQATIILHCLSLLLPANMLLLCFAKDRGIINPAGLVRLCFILAQPLAIYYLLQKNPGIFNHLNHTFISHHVIDKLHIPQPIVLFYLVASFVILILSFLRKKGMLKGFFWAMVASAVAFHAAYQGSGVSLYFSVSGLIIVLSMLETAYAMAYNDELTGLPARRALNTTMQNLGRRYTIAMLDIDFFKKFNDKYGHDVGDQVLCMVASHIDRVGGGGKPFRYGGEEFTVVFPGKSTQDARPYLEKLRESIAKARFKVRGKNRPRKTPKRKTKAKNPKTVSVTISIGAAEPGRSLNKPSEVIKAADKALYRAKKKGRNCTII